MTSIREIIFNDNLLPEAMRQRVAAILIEGPTFEEMFECYWEWGKDVFVGTIPSQSSKGLIREAKELDEALNSDQTKDQVLEEMSDVMFYLIHILRKSGYSHWEFINAMKKKLSILKVREWKRDETGCYSHVKKETK